jgi:B12-binding domain/radical SAM domain protein
MRVICHHARSGTTALQVVTAALDVDARTAGVEVVFAKTADQVASAIDATDGEPLVLWSFYSADFAWMRDALAKVKGRTRRGLHVAGGVHATAEPRQTLGAGYDLVTIGEGETTLIELCVAHREARDVRALAGTAHIDASSARFVTHGPGERRELDAYPAFFERYGRWNAIEITRGCIYACTFCQTPTMFKARFRHRSVENVAAAVAKMGPRFVRFLTPTALSYGSAGTEPNLDAVEALLAAVRGASKTAKIYFGTFPSEVRPEHVTPRALEIIARHCDNRSLVIGGQSGSERVLERMRRGHGVDDVVRAVETCKANGFRADVDFLFGLPDESDEDREDTIRLAKRLVALGNARIHSHAFMPLPGTPMRGVRQAPIVGRTLRMIEELEGKGLSYGQWRGQGLG